MVDVSSGFASSSLAKREKRVFMDRRQIVLGRLMPYWAVVPGMAVAGLFLRDPTKGALCQ